MARVWPAVAALSGVALVLVVAATTELFEPADIGAESYQVGFDAGRDRRAAEAGAAAA